MAYQNRSTFPARRLAAADAQDDLQTRIADAARVTTAAVAVRSEDEQQLLYDFSRGRGIVRLGQWCAISERAFREADAVAVAEAIRGHILYRRRMRAQGLLGLLDAVAEETHSNGPADEAGLRFLVNPGRGTRDGFIEALSRQEVASRSLIDLLHTTDFTGSMRHYIDRQLIA
jgi:hypothetical protein